jgi:hypothetical protein
VSPPHWIQSAVTADELRLRADFEEQADQLRSSFASQLALLRSAVQQPPYATSASAVVAAGTVVAAMEVSAGIESPNPFTHDHFDGVAYRADDDDLEGDLEDRMRAEFEVQERQLGSPSVKRTLVASSAVAQVCPAELAVGRAGLDSPHTQPTIFPPPWISPRIETSNRPTLMDPAGSGSIRPAASPHTQPTLIQTAGSGPMCVTKYAGRMVPVHWAPCGGPTLPTRKNPKTQPARCWI